MTAGILAGCGNSKTEPKQEAPAADQAAEPEDTAAADQAESEEPETQEENAEVDPR